MEEKIKKTKKPLKKVGRPKIELDLNELEKLSSLNCTMPEIAHFFDIPLRTLEDKYTNDEKVRATIDRGRADGKISLRRQQIQIMNDGNPTMAIWLGKQLLGKQREQKYLRILKLKKERYLI